MAIARLTDAEREAALAELNQWTLRGDGLAIERTLKFADFAEAFGFDVQFSVETSDLYYDRITEALATDVFRPRALFDRFGIEVIATTESPLDTLEHHAVIRAANASGEWGGLGRPGGGVGRCRFLIQRR